MLACEPRVESPYVPGIASPLGGTYARSQGAPRGLWVLCEGAQRVLEHEERLDWLLDDAEAMGVSDLFVQVYRGGRAWFDSELADPAPYAKTWRSPRGDALTTLIARAHDRGLRVHAWMNALSLSGNSAAPVLTRLGRQAVIVDQHGRSVLDYPGFDVPPGDRDYYRIDTPAVWLDPAAPGVAGYLEDLVAELLNRHPALDGIHLDYIRYPTALPFSPGTRFGVGLSFGHGESVRARFQEETGLRAPFRGSLINGNRFDEWRRDKLSELVARVAGRARVTRPGVLVSAAVWAFADRAYLSTFQDWRGWVADGLIDLAVPMLYTRDDRLFRYASESFAGLRSAPRIWVGVGAWLFAEEPERVGLQLSALARRPPLGQSLFSWDSIRENDALHRALTGAPPEETEALPEESAEGDDPEEPTEGSAEAQREEPADAAAEAESE
ncbi:MAG: family 10 glycosylhydrolase [Myxococcales bacterium]|nr:family 10 glycosylhydrolase [Myxococcales bacterium]